MVIEGARKQPATDADVIARSMRRPECFFDLFDRHFRPLHRFLRARGAGDSADDLAAETFLVAFNKRGHYDQSRPDARAWLFGIALNLARNEARASRRSMRLLPQLAERPVEPQAQVLERLTTRAWALGEALADLTSEERDVLLLYACEGLSYAEVGEAVGCELGTVRSRLHRARTKVRHRLTIDEDRGGNDAG